MRRPSSHSLQLFDGPELGSAEQRAAATTSGFSEAELIRAEQLACQETWRPFPPRRPTTPQEPYSLAWFDKIQQRRYARHGHWIPKLFEFHRHRGDQVLGLGDGLGTDWIQYAANGSSLHYCTPSTEALALTKRNFELHEQRGEFLHGSLTSIPLPNEAMDVVCLSALSGNLSVSLDAVIGEIYRVLKPGGKVIAAIPAKYDAHWWQDFWFPWNRWIGARSVPRDQHFSGGSLRKRFVGFDVKRIHKRHLRRSDLPHIWRWMLLPFLERMMGRFLVLKAFKPVSAGISSRAAA